MAGFFFASNPWCLMAHAFTRGDVVACGPASYVVWTHGQGHLSGFPCNDRSISLLSPVDLSRLALKATGRATDKAMASLREGVARAIEANASRLASQWEAAEPVSGGSLDGRYRVDPWGSPGGQWVQPCRAAA